MTKTKLQTASVLAFERKLDPSDALFYAGNWQQRSQCIDWAAIKIREKAVRGVISNRLKAKDQNSAKLDAEIEKANLQRVDVAALPNDCDSLMVCFSLRVLSGAGVPSACNNAEYKQALSNTVRQYIDQHQFSELAMRYAYNLANARFLWRNRIGAEDIEVHIKQLQNGQAIKQWCFDAYQFSLKNFVIEAAQKAELQSLADLINLGLLGEKHVLLEITAFVRIGPGQEVYPSQELILDRDNKKKGQKSKTLYSINDIAGMHSQKIGNAIRTIDTWYPQDNNIGPIAIEPYGSVTSMGKAFRQPKEKIDFYHLLDNWVLQNKMPESVDDQHYVMATLIRGGVFGEGKE